MQFKLFIVFAVIITAFVVLVGRLIYINLQYGNEYSKIVLSSQKNDSVTIPFEQKVVAHNLERMRAFDWKYTLIILLAVFMVVSGSMIYVHETAVIKAKEQQVYDLKEKKEDLLGKQSALKGQIDKSIDLKAIKSYASKKLNMTMPDKKHVLYYSGGSGSYFYQFESVNAGK